MFEETRKNQEFMSLCEKNGGEKLGKVNSAKLEEEGECAENSKFWETFREKNKVTHHARCVAHIASCILTVWLTLGHIY